MADFITTYKTVEAWGKPVKINFRPVTQMLNLRLNENAYRIPRRPGDNPAIGLVEGLQFIAGTAELEPMKVAAPGAKHSLFGLNSYYGPRIASQVPRVINELKYGGATRRAVIMIAHPHDSPNTIPCTLTAQFTVTQYDGGPRVLHPVFTMRSADLVYGIPYDLIQFNMLSHAISCCVHAHVYQDLCVNLGNAHTYESTKVDSNIWKYGSFVVPYYSDSWENWVAWAREFVYAKELANREQMLTHFRVTSYNEGGENEAAERVS